MTVDRNSIRVKAMLVAFNDSGDAQAVSVNPATAEDPQGYHRLIGGSVELGETHRDAVIREVDEELGATIDSLSFLGTLENIFRIDGELGHEIVFVYSGRLNPMPGPEGTTLTEMDGSTTPVVWRSLGEDDADLPLYPSGVFGLLQAVSQPFERSGCSSAEAAVRSRLQTHSSATRLR